MTDTEETGTRTQSINSFKNECERKENGMALFNNNDTEKEEGAGTVQENVSLTEEEQLNVQIEQLRKEISDLYTDIGQEYYESGGNEPVSDHMSSCFDDIRAREEKIQDCKNEIRTIKGITTCEHCGADIFVTDTFCGTCGARIISEITISSTGGNCPSCGQKVYPGQQYCSTCGARINISDESMEEEIPNETSFVSDGFPDDTEDIPKSQDPVQEERAIYCSNCGARLEPGDLFCMNCGQKVEE